MKSFTFAIASIVDANTGFGLNHGGSQSYAQAERHGRTIRSRAVADLFGRVRTSLSELVEAYRQRVQERRDLQRLLRLNDHMLADIGLSRGDLVAVELGSIRLEELQAQREANRADKLLQLKSDSKLTRLEDATEAANEQDFDNRKCA